MKIINVLLFSLLAVTSTFAQDATIAYRDTNDMFNGKIETGTNAPLPPPSESFNFIKSYTLKIRWRTYLGEPLERYEFGWERNDSYTINVDGEKRTILMHSLGKYPDLRARFIRIRPTRVDIKLEGTAGGRTKDEMGAFGVGKINIPGEGTVDFVSYNYIVKDDDLLIGVSGFPKMQWVDSAPETWNEFLNWKGGFKSFNIPTNEFKRLSREEQSKRVKDIKSIWKQINAISISGSIENIEWPELEMIDIIKTYDRYKNKKKEPSPQEKLEEALAKVENTPEYTKNDDWGELPKLKEEFPEITINYDLRTTTEDYLYEGMFINKNSGEKLDIINKVYDAFVKKHKDPMSNFDNRQSNIRIKAIETLDSKILIFTTEVFYLHRRDNFYPPQYILFNLADDKVIVSDVAINEHEANLFLVNEEGRISSISKIENEEEITSNNNKFSYMRLVLLSNEFPVLKKSFRKHLEKLEKGKSYYIMDQQTGYDYLSVYDNTLKLVGNFYQDINRDGEYVFFKK